MAFVTEHKETILSIIEGWRGKFSDELLGKKLQLELGLKKAPSRHTLAKHDDIKLAIDLKRKELKDKKSQAEKDAKQLFDSGDKLSSLLCNLDNEDTTISELIKRAENLEKENGCQCVPPNSAVLSPCPSSPRRRPDNRCRD